MANMVATGRKETFQSFVHAYRVEGNRPFFHSRLLCVCDNTHMQNDPKETLRESLTPSAKIAFLGGAGVSVASGIPDFRSASGLYNQTNRWNLPAEEILSSDYFYAHTKEFYEFYWENMVFPNAKPNKAHLALARYEENHDVAVLTQNIDGLHSLAGSKEVYEFHGSVLHYHCLRCGKHETLDHIEPHGVPICSCGGVLKPDVVLYGEALPSDVVEEGIHKLSQADILIVGGTSLRVYPFAQLPYYFRGSLSVLVNKEPTPMDNQFDLVFHEDVGTFLEEILK